MRRSYVLHTTNETLICFAYHKWDAHMCCMHTTNETLICVATRLTHMTFSLNQWITTRRSWGMSRDTRDMTHVTCLMSVSFVVCTVATWLTYDNSAYTYHKWDAHMWASPECAYNKWDAHMFCIPQMRRSYVLRLDSHIWHFHKSVHHYETLMRHVTWHTWHDSRDMPHECLVVWHAYDRFIDSWILWHAHEACHVTWLTSRDSCDMTHVTWLTWRDSWASHMWSALM